MIIAVIGTGYVGLVTGVALAEIGHHVTCIDIDKQKVEKLRSGISPIFEPGLEELMAKNMEEGRLFFTASYPDGVKAAEVIYLAVGTPENEDGSANLTYIEQAAAQIAKYIEQDAVVVTKSTVPVGTNHYLKRLLTELVPSCLHVEVVSNPEFLREGSSVHDTFHGDRIVIGADSPEAACIIEEINKPFGIPIFKTDVKSAEMIKYASNAFLAAKISFINEIANICEKLGADVEKVARGMGMDQRIGSMFLKAGIGYGGSCFPKDTKALTQIAAGVDHDFELLKAVITVNNKQQERLLEKAIQRFGTLAGKRAALLGLSFKPNTDDMREAPSITVSQRLLEEGVRVSAYDPAAMVKARRILPGGVEFAESIQAALSGADMVFILTDWREFKELELTAYTENMKNPVIFDGRNCYEPDTIEKFPIEYHSIGRKSVMPNTPQQ